jgi:hypothetical protein
MGQIGGGEEKRRKEFKKKRKTMEKGKEILGNISLRLALISIHVFR